MAIDPGRVKALFQAAIGRDDPAERRAFLDVEAGDDAELRERLDDLLAAHDRPPGVLDRPLDADYQATTDAPGVTVDFSLEPPFRTLGDEPTGSHRVAEGAPPLDTVIAGRYRLRQQIGEGGMGSVYLAEQLQPVKRQVALKLIKPGMDSRNVLVRFESERQALALMDHPLIAKVLDAGTTEQGRPFFVMELVKGIPLTEYCDRHQRDLPTRLAIFRQICSAVQHAHQKGIIHRDLKPTNILVESHDGKPVPKVIDFGLAKATSGMQLSDHSLFTAFGTVTGTPLYMAPEQATFNALDVDTRADIYALGVILYELLTGSTPIQRGTLQRAGLDEMLRVIREDEPPTPSSRIGTSEGLPSLAANRHVEPSRLSRLVRGDLDWIVMKAMAKERDRRYDSAIGLANDVDRYLNHEPVTAGPPTAAYRMRKFVRRHRGQVAAAALVLLALVLGVVGTTLGLFEARRQEGRAERQKDIAIAEAAAKETARLAEAAERARAEMRLAEVAKMNAILGSIFSDLDPTKQEQDGRPLAAVLGERLDAATAAIEGEEAGDPLSLARMRSILASTQLGLGFPEKAISLLVKVRPALALALGPDHPETIRSMLDLASSYHEASQQDRAVELREQVVERALETLGKDQPLTIRGMLDLAESYFHSRKRDQALKLREQALTVLEAKFGPDHPDTLRCVNGLASSYQAWCRLEETIKLRWRTLERMKVKLGPDHLETLRCAINLASNYHNNGERARAFELRERTLERLRAKFGRNHPTTQLCMLDFAWSQLAAGHPDKALELREEVLALASARSGSDHPDTLRAMMNVADSCQVLGLSERALKLRQDAYDRYRARLGPDHPDTLWAENILLDTYLRARRFDRAVQIAEEAAASALARLGPRNENTIRASRTRDQILKLAEAQPGANRQEGAPTSPDRSKMMDLLRELRNAGKEMLAGELANRVESIARQLDLRVATGHTIFGRVVVDGPEDPQRVDAQMRILKEGYFADNVGEAGKPVGFRLHGYEPVDVIPSGKPGSIEDVGIVRLTPLAGPRQASLSGKVVLEGQPDARGASANLSIMTGPINRLSGGYEGMRGIQIPPIPVVPAGGLAGSGYVPTRHRLYVSAPGYWSEYREIEFAPGRDLDIGTVRLELGCSATVTMMVAGSPSFVAARPVTVASNSIAGWAVRSPDRETPYMLLLDRLGGKEVRIRSSHGPVEFADLGDGPIEEIAKLDLSQVPMRYEGRPVAVSGQVYLARWRFGEDEAYALFRLAIEKVTPEKARALMEERGR